MRMISRRVAMGSGLALTALAGRAAAQTGDKYVIGVMGDQSGVVSDVGGKGSVLAARMAVAAFGGQVLGRPIEILVADHQNKPDVASPIARRWFDNEKVEAIFDLPHTGVVLALQQIAREKRKSLLVSGAASVEITGKSCSPYTTHWTDDTYALANATARAVTKGAGETWYFLTADYSFGHDLERDASNTIRALGGKVLGSARHPLSTQDFSAYLLQAQTSKAKIIGLASAGADTVNAIKQAREYQVDAHGQRLAALHAFVTDVNSLGLATAQGLIITTGFYWDSTDGTRAWARSFMADHGRMPTREQAGVYAAVLHYLKAVQAVGKPDAAAINAAMRKMPVDRFGQAASVRADGRVIYDIGVYQVKTPSESTGPWDYYRRLANVPGAEAFRPVADGGCASAQQASQ
ncbi:ABC transporter substrate-binding protein [Reyranella sp.]|uniref:ABC transporter substrate-binding protein n=1 Tax=Reyranella sp. TaxID=1929291 RepID=UPI003BA8B8FC